MLTFHILDAFTQDAEIQEETEEYITKVYNDDIEPEVDDEEIPKPTSNQFGNQVNLEKNTMVIHLFGTTAEGKAVRANVYGFQPYFYIRLPDKKVSTSKKFIDLFHAKLANKKIPKSCASVEICQKKLLYGYTGNTMFPFAMIKTNSLACFRKVRSLFVTYEKSEPCFRLDDRCELIETEYGGKKYITFNGKGPALDLYDANLDPMLRFFHIQNIQPCGWISIDGELEGNDQIDCRWDEVKPAKGPVPIKVGGA